MPARELPKAYEPQTYEDKIYTRWEKGGFFAPESTPEWVKDDHKRESFSMVLPPPNVTGTLHMGHAVMLAVQDVMARYHRMKGDRTLWIPGTDHAAVATESKVEKMLIDGGMKKPKTELGREKFLKHVEKFATESHDTIVNQAKKMGASLDWSREAFTLDKPRNTAVNTLFKMMYDDGLIYRGYRVINWSVKGQSTCSDDELVHVERPGKLYYFTYGPECPIMIATTRPETKLGDTAIAVNPKGKWKKYIGKEFVIKNFGQTGHVLKLKVIGDIGVDDAFGTGALGVTPAHSQTDFEIYQKNKDIGLIQVIGEDGNMTDNAGKMYAGLTIEEARKKVVVWLEKQKLLEKTEETIQNVGTSDRFGDVVEPLPKTQWFIEVNKKFKIKDSRLKSIKSGQLVTLKQLMQTVVKTGDITIIPDRFNKTYFHWIDNLRDWNISRQIWYGHQIPVWYRGDEIFVGTEPSIETSLREQFPPLATGQYDERTKKAIVLFKKIATKAKEKKWKYAILSGFAVDSQLGYISRNHKDVDFLIDRKSIKEVVSFLRKEGHVVCESKKYGAELLRVDPLDEETTRAAHCDIHISFYDAQKNEVVVPMLGKEIRFGGSYEEISISKELLEVEAQVLNLNLLIQEKNDWVEKIGLSGRDERNESEIKKIEQIKNASSKWEQDPDTLDTWFSSGSWTFSTLGWPRTTVGFVRHGEAENNVAKKVSDDIGSSNLTEKGRKQVADLAKKIKKENFEIIVASPVLRAKQTAEILAEKLGLPIEFLDDRIREVGFGKLDHHTEAEIEKERDAKGWMVKTPFGMESYVSLRKRTHEFMEDLIAKYPGKRILVVSHGDTLGVLKQFGTDLYTNDVSPTQDKATCDTRNFANNGKQSNDLEFFHPTSVLETGYDILFFWVARMILMSTYALGEVPFKTVYLHGLVRDEEGRKMSKSLGNIIDPLDMIKKYGTDATRLSLLIGGTPGSDMRLSEEKIAGFRNFTNKLWNISRFMLLNIQEPVKGIKKPKAQTAADEWILSKLNKIVLNTTKAIEQYQFSAAGESLRDFTWGDLADWYLEIAKVESISAKVSPDKGNKDVILNYILNTVLKLWHPYMPFVTEAIWKEMYGKDEMLMVEKYPKADKENKASEKIVFIEGTLRNVITKIRAIRTEYRIEPGKKLVAGMMSKDNNGLIKEYTPVFMRLAGLESVLGEKKPVGAISFTESGVEVWIDLSSAVDTTKEKARIEKEIATVEPYVLQLEKKLSNKEFVKNAPKVVVDIEKKKLEEARQKLESLSGQLKQLT